MMCSQEIAKMETGRPFEFSSKDESVLAIADPSKQEEWGPENGPDFRSPLSVPHSKTVVAAHLPVLPVRP